MIILNADSDDGRVSPSKSATLDAERQPLVGAPPPYFDRTPKGGPDSTVPAAKRFIRAFGVALLIYLLAATTIGCFVAPSRIRYRWVRLMVPSFDPKLSLATIVKPKPRPR